MADKKKKAIIDSLEEYGLDRKSAELLADKLDTFKELTAEELAQVGEDGGSGEPTGEPEGFVEGDARGLSIDGKARLDMARLLLDLHPEDSIEKRIAMSEIPAPSMMHLCLSKTLDDLCSKKKNGEIKRTPTEVFITNFTTFMLGINRKNRKEGLQLFETDSEKTSDTTGLFPSLQG